MVPNVFASLFYVVSLVTLLLGMIIVRKTQQKMNVLVWIPVAIMAITGYQSFFAAIFSFLSIPVNIFTLGITNFLASGYFALAIKKKEEKQEYYFDWMNLLGYGALGLVLMFLMMRTCGIELSPHYLAVDAAVHLEGAMGLINYESVSGMFYAKLHHGLFIEVFAPFVSSAVYYKLFVLSDMCHSLFTWIMFYCLIEKYAKDKFMKVAAIIVSVIYAVGYPMNSTLFGFTYLGMALTVIAYLLIVYDWYMREDFNEKYSIILLSLGCLNIFETYVLFMPVVFFTILFTMFYKQYKKKQLFSWHTIKSGLSIFLMPTVIGLWFTYGGIFNASTEVTVASAISNEGGIYKDLFSNFVILVPFALFGFYKLIKEKKNKLVLWLLPMLLVFILGLFSLGLKGQVSSYYYYKTYYVLWLLMFELFFVAITYFEKEIRVFLLFGFGTWLAILTAFFLNVEGAIQKRNAMLCVSNKAGIYNEIFWFNRDAISLPCYSENKLELYRYAVENLQPNGEVITLASTWDDFYWMKAITNQDLDYGYYYWNWGTDLYFETLDKDADYVIVIFESDFYKANVDRFAQYENIFTNGFGAILKIK